MVKTLEEIAVITGGRLVGDSSVKISGATNIVSAGKTEITFADEKHIEAAAQCNAGAVILPEGVNVGEDFPLPAVYVEDTRAAFAKLLVAFTPPLNIPVGVHEKAVIGNNVTLGKNVRIMAYAVVDDNAKIGDNVTLYPHTYIGQYAEVGDDTVLYSSVTIREFCKIGKRVVIHSSAVIGADGFGFTTKDGIHTKVPQVGNVVVEDDVEIGAHVGIDRAMTGSTIIGHGTKIDNLVHVGHNCQIGPNNLIVAQTGISGSTNSGENVTFGGQVGTNGHINIGAHSVFAARSGITKNTPPGVFYAGLPARPHQEWLRSTVAVEKLPEALKQLKQMEKRLKKLEEEK